MRPETRHGAAHESGRTPAHRPGRQPELRQDRAVQPAHRQPPEGGQLRRRHRRAQGRLADRTLRPALCRARLARCLQPACRQPGRGGDPRPDPRLLPGRAGAGPAGVRGGRHQPAPAPALRAGTARAGAADAGGAEHERRGPPPRHRDRPAGAAARAGRAGGGDRGGAPRRRADAAAAAGCAAGGAGGEGPGRRSGPARRGTPAAGADGAHAAPHRGDRRRARPLAAAPGVRAAGAGAGDVPGVPGGVCLGDADDGRDRDGHPLGGRLGGRRDGGRAAAQPAGGRRDRRHRRGDRVPAADPGAVPVHPRAGGIRLPAACGVPARPRHGRRRAVRTQLHPAAVQLRLRGAGDHVHPQHPGPARPPGHHPGGAADDLLGAVAGVHPADRRLRAAARGRSVQPAGAGAVRAVPGRHPQRTGGGLDHEEVAARPERAPAAAGAAFVPGAASARPADRAVGARDGFPQAGRRDHPRADHPAVVPAQLPGRAGRGDRPGHQLQLRRPHRAGHDHGVRADRVQLADLHRADPRAGRARGGGVLAGERV